MAGTKATTRKAKKTTQRSAGAPTRDNGHPATKQFVVTLDVPKRDIVKIEKLEKSGRRQNASDEDFAMLVGEDEAQDFGDVLEEAYAAGVHDATHDVDDDDDTAGDQGLDMLHQGIRQIILRRALRRELVRRRKPAGRMASA